MKDHFDENNHVDLTEVDSVVSSIIHSFISRARLGKEKYGKTLDRTDLKVKDWINHAQEELMDGILYLEKLKQTSGTMLLNHDPSPSPPESPLPSPSPMIEVKYRQNSESVCGGKDCACDKSNKVEPLQNENNMNIEYQISVLTGEQCNIEKNVVKNSSLPESKLLFDNFKMNAKQQGITALILYAVDTLTFESKSIMNWFADEINYPIENKDDTMDAELQEQYCGF